MNFHFDLDFWYSAIMLISAAMIAFNLLSIKKKGTPAAIRAGSFAFIGAAAWAWRENSPMWLRVIDIVAIVGLLAAHFAYQSADHVKAAEEKGQEKGQEHMHP